MPINLNDLNIFLKGDTALEDIQKLSAIPIFSDTICIFLSELSNTLLKMPEAKAFPDVITFAFFCRKANIEKIKSAYTSSLESRLGRGVVFHIAPSNVPINFAYSLVAGLLAGNVCIVRVSNKPFAQTNIVCNAIKNVLGNNELAHIKDYITVLNYDHTGTEATDFFCSICDVRVIWGGDNTIDTIRRSPLPPRSYDVNFADRYSFAVISANEILALKDTDAPAQDFYNDTFLYDQNACSSPRLIFWVGSAGEIDQAKKKFWTAINDFANQRYNIEPVIAVDKIVTLCKTAIDFSDVKQEETPSNLLSLIEIGELKENITEYRCAGGSFIEHRCTDLSETFSELKKIVNRKYQTLSYFGFDHRVLRDLTIKNGLQGIDRIVPVGKTADFNFYWDGYDLIDTLSRNISSY